MLKPGEFVTRKSYGGDIVFKIQHIQQQNVILKGVEFRLLADAPLIDLQQVHDLHRHRSTVQVVDKLQENMRSMEQKQKLQREKNEGHLLKKTQKPYPFFEMPGKVLHLDGDPLYLRKSMQLYNQLRVPAEGYYVPEANMAATVYRLLPRVKPDILVVTGHDGLIKHRKEGGKANLQNYKNSLYFVQAVQAAREYERDRDALTIIAGACQSYFEALLHVGANFASSPARILIHALDPVYIATKAAYTPIKDTINIYDVISHTISGIDGLGGIESRGSYRIGLPKIQA